MIKNDTLVELTFCAFWISDFTGIQIVESKDRIIVTCKNTAFSYYHTNCLETFPKCLQIIREAYTDYKKNHMEMITVDNTEIAENIKALLRGGWETITIE